jgi:2,3-bisphosphoglycerate-independent phosphoglycerate mutase
MKIHDLTRELQESNGSKIVLVVADGLGGLPIEPGTGTELETAYTPNLDSLARTGVCGLSVPVLPGITPGSGPGHLGLFGYDPLEHRIGRGVLEATGINVNVGPRDVAIRGNFCTLDNQGLITDRRAGRPNTDRCKAMVEKMRSIRLPGADLIVEPVREHRFVVVLRADGLGDQVNDTDPQATGVAPLSVKGADSASTKTANLANAFVAEATKVLQSESPTNGVTLRGFARRPALAPFQDVYGLRAAALAVYPMYKGIARLVGMEILDCGTTLADQVKTLGTVWDQFDFFFLHFKYTDSTGEDGNFPAKVEMIQQLDAAMPAIAANNPDVLIVTGDHSTPSLLRSHSWHPVPVLLSAATCRPDGASEFNERACLHGGLGQFEAKYLMLYALAHARRLAKFGA